MPLTPTTASTMNFDLLGARIGKPRVTADGKAREQPAVLRSEKEPNDLLAQAEALEAGLIP